MHSFLWSGKDRDGKTRSERVEAENAQAARAILTEQGWTELQLLRDEIGDAVKRRHRAETEIKVPELTPDQEASRFWGKRPSFAAKWGKSFLSSWTAFVIFGLIGAIGVQRHDPQQIWLGGGGVLVTLLLFPVIHLFYSQSSRNYARLNQAKVEGRWNEVLECVEKLRRSKRATKVGVGEVELARNRAVALASLGRLDEAIREFSAFENSPTTPHWLHLSHMAGIYSAGRQYDKALEYQLQKMAEKPDMATGWIDLAGMLAKRMKRPAEAREALARAGKLEIIPLGKPHMLVTEGVILWREARLPEAKLKLEQALIEFKPFARKPLVEHSILSAKSYLCAVNRALGNQAEADKLFKEVEKFLVAHQEDELLRACRLS